MNGMTRKAGFVLALALASGGAFAPSAGAQSPAAPQTAEHAFKNIRVLQDIPAEQLLPTMQFFEASLGVGCNFCHLQARELDAKPEKQIAREMVLMVSAINKETFGGQLVVTCYSCHRGSTKPVGIPPAEAFRPPEAGPPAGREAEGLLDKYLLSLGGMDALQKISSRVVKGTIADPAGRKIAIELWSKAPDKGAAVLHNPTGDNLQSYTGNAGWVRNAGTPLRDMRGDELDAARIGDQLYFPARLKQSLSDLRTGPAEKVGDRETNVVLGTLFNRVPMKLYFDKTSGTLLRNVYYTQTAVGLLPTQVDFADYRDADGAKVAYRWTVSRPQSQGLQTFQIEQLQQNVPIEESRFSRPSASVASR